MRYRVCKKNCDVPNDASGLVIDYKRCVHATAIDWPVFDSQ